MPSKAELEARVEELEAQLAQQPQASGEVEAVLEEVLELARKHSYRDLPGAIEAYCRKMLPEPEVIDVEPEPAVEGEEASV